MGLTYRKSVKLGKNLQINLSKAGIGFSTGVKGMRYSVGPRGTYVTLGAKGFRYRKKVSSPSRKKQYARAHPQPTFENAQESKILPSSVENNSGKEEQLVTEINQHISTFQFPLGAVCRWLTVGLACNLVYWSPNFAVIEGLIVLIPGLIGSAIIEQICFAQRWTGHVYDLNQVEDICGLIDKAFARLTSSSAIWQVSSLDDFSAQTRVPAKLQIEKVIPYIHTNLDSVWSISTNDARLYFFPEQIFAYKNSQYTVFPYTSLQVRVKKTAELEPRGFPFDSIQTGFSWLHETRDGSPDLRFKENRKIPIVEYGALHIFSTHGLDLKLLVSNSQVAEDFQLAWAQQQDAIEHLYCGSREESIDDEDVFPPSETNPANDDDDDGEEYSGILARVVFLTILVIGILFGACLAFNSKPTVSSNTSYLQHDSTVLISALLNAAKEGDDVKMLEAEAALKDLSEAQIGDLAKANSQNKIGLAALKAKQFSKAAECFLLASKSDSSQGKWLSNLGYAELHQGKLQQAKEHLLQSLKIDASRAVAWGNLSEVYAQLGEKELAVDAMLVGFHTSRGENRGYIESLIKTEDRPASVKAAAREALNRLEKQ